MSENGHPQPSINARTLHQRIAAIAGEAQVKVSGRTAPTAGARPALSIADVDRVLGDLMAEHGVTSDFEFLSEPTDYIEITANDKKLKTYRVHLRVYVTNAEDPSEFITREVWDDGSNISGAVSFALKRYLRALFHLAEDDDTQQAQQRQAQRQDFTPPREARQEPPPPPRSAPSGPQLSAAQLADRIPLYETAERLGKTRQEAENWVNTLLDTPQPNGDTVSLGSIRKKLDAEEGKRRASQAEAAKPSEPQDGAKEAEPTKDPAALVCPYCGNADAPGDIAAEPDRMRCWTGKGGCSKSFDATERISRSWYEQGINKREPSELAELAQPTKEELENKSRLERLAAEAAPVKFCSLCGVAAPDHAPDCFSLEARQQRGEVQAGATGNA